MKDITISFSSDELRELAKQLYLGGYFLNGTDYDNIDMVNEIMNRVCAIGMAEAPETGAFRHGGPGEPMFFISRELDDECDPLVQLFEDYAVQEHVPYSLADRDFREQYGEHEPEEIVADPKLFAALKTIQKKYLDEFERYGVTHLRLEEPK